MPNCPICQSKTNTMITNINCGNFDRSHLYKNAEIRLCEGCSHVFNYMTNRDIMGLQKYYEEEYPLLNLEGTNKTLNSHKRNRYKQIFEFIKPFINIDSNILDIGCGAGGFLDFLREKGFRNLHGVDSSLEYVNRAKQNDIDYIDQGLAKDLPFENNTFDFVLLEQVLEHSYDPIQDIKGIKRVLRNDGLLYVGVPNASAYKDFSFFCFYWFLMREHIHHFDLNQLMNLATVTEFNALAYSQSSYCLVGESTFIPSLSVILSMKPQNKDNIQFASPCLKKNILQYIRQEESAKQFFSKKILEMIASQKEIYVWGIGREFLFLYESMGLDECNIVGLLDSNSLKRKNLSVTNMKILNPNKFLPTASRESILLITAYSHANEICRMARSIGFKGEIMCIKKGMEI